MKKILTNNITENVRKQPFNKASYEHIQEAFQEVFADMLKGITTSDAGIVVLHGCVDSDGSSTAWNISEGAVLYNGEVFKIPAFIGTHATQVPVMSLATAYRAGDPVKFSDNNDFNVHEIRTMAWAMGVSGSGLVDFGALKRLKDTIKPASIMSADGSFIRCKKMPLPVWDMETDPFLEVAHELPDGNKIFRVDVMIRNDANTSKFPLDYKIVPAGQGDGRVSGGWDGFTGVGNANIYLVRTEDTGTSTSGIFANSSYSNVSGGYSRGEMIIWYYE